MAAKKATKTYEVEVSMTWSQSYTVKAKTAAEARRKAWEKFKRRPPKSCFTLMEAEGYKHLVELGHIKDGDKICQDKDTGAFGTKDGLAAFFKFYDDSRAAIPKECDPQEVYFYEYNNHECMIAWDGDKEAYDLIVGYWGEEVAKTIERL